MSTIQDKIYTYFERNSELKVLSIFNNPFILAEIQDLNWNPGYRFVIFKGDWFTVKYNLDNDWANDKVIIYFNQASPLKKKSLAEKFPLMDVLVANMEYHNQDYAAFMQQYHLPQTMATFAEKNIMQLQSDKMIKLLESYYVDGSINVDVAVRGFISSYLSQQHVLSWDEIIIRMLLLATNISSNKTLDFYKKLSASKSINTALNNKLISIFGVSYNPNSEYKVDKIVQVLKYNAMVQNLVPVDADNYRQNRITDTTQLQQMNRILELALSQVKSAEAFMQVLSELGKDIHDDDIIKWYGTDANYYFIPNELCIPILRTLMGKYISEEPEHVINRIENLMIKYSDNEDLNEVMDYAILVARFYEKALSLGNIILNTPIEYVERYKSDYYIIDQLYRLSTESYYKFDAVSILFDTIQNVKTALDLNYAKLINRINLGWTNCVKDAGGFASLNILRQQDFYRKNISSIQKKVVVIVSDALRYEMAEQLIEELAKKQHIAKLNCGLAMLPTETKYCKPALLPHKSLKLYGNTTDQNMSVDDKILSDTAKRSAHVQGYKDGAICVPFSEVSQFIRDKNREIFKHSLVYIFHDDIDNIGHDGTTKQITQTCSQSIKDLATLIFKILSTYNVTEIYATADHGFLFNDITFADKDKHKIAEETLERSSRYYLTDSDVKVQGIVKFPLAEVSGMDNAANVFVAVPEGTNRLASPSGGYKFTHGGASLQEILIPIISCKQERDGVKQPVGVMLLNRNLSMQASRLRFDLLQTDPVNMDMKERNINIALYLNDKAVTAIKSITLDKTDQMLDNRKYTVDLTLNQNVDAKVLQLKVYDDKDDLNPLIKENITNNTLIENDFDF